MPRLTIVIPNYNSSGLLRRCLESVNREKGPRPPGEIEVIVVDDGSTDDSPAVARSLGAKVYQLEVNSGPAVARNHGAQHAAGELLWFIDADVEACPGALEAVLRFFDEHPQAAAVIGLYDDEPSAPNLCSQFKNLFHHFVHSQSHEKVASFWSGCGAIRREVFLSAGGFDEDYWREPMIEDIHLGYALGRAGHEIRLIKELQVKHHKTWTLYSLVKTDLFHRAIPWTNVLLHNKGEGSSELNLKSNYKYSVAAVGLALIAATLGLHWPWLLATIPPLLAAAPLLNLDLLKFFARKRGVGFAISTIPLLWLYFFYCGLGFLMGSALYRYERWTGREIFKQPHETPVRELEEPAPTEGAGNP